MVWVGWAQEDAGLPGGGAEQPPRAHVLTLGAGACFDAFRATRAFLDNFTGQYFNVFGIDLIIRC
jgi:hypothetical protein